MSAVDNMQVDAAAAPMAGNKGPPQPCNSGNTDAAVAAALHTVSRNEVLVHQLLLQDGSLLSSEALQRSGQEPDEEALRRLAETDPEAASQAAVAAVARRAFWDALQQGLQAPPPEWGRLVALVGEARGQLLEVVPNGSARARGVRAALNEKLDEDYISYRLAQGHDLAYLRQLFDFIVHTVQQLEAPARNEATAATYAAVLQRLQAANAAAGAGAGAAADGGGGVSVRIEAADGGGVSVELRPAAAGLAPGVAVAVAAAMRFVTEKVGELRGDVARYRLEMLRSVLTSEAAGIEYERRRYERAVELAGSCVAALPVTAAWLADARREVEAQAGGGGAGRADKESVRRVVAAGIVALVQRPASIAGGPGRCPETLLLDAQRLVGFQNELQRLSLAAASTLVAQQLLAAQGGRARGDFSVRVRARFLALLADPGVRMEQLTEEAAELVCAELAACGARCDAEAVAALSRAMLSKVYNTTDPVYRRVQGGLAAGLALYLERAAAAPGADVLPALRGALRGVGAEALAGEVRAWGAEVARMLALNLAVAGPYYERLLATPAVASRSEE